MADQISFPFRLGPNGQVATVAQFSDQANAEGIALLLLVRAGEREMLPGFGTPDPLFHGVDQGALTAGVAAFLPGVTVDDIQVSPGPDGVSQKINVDFT